MLADFKAWWRKPYDDNMSVTSWFLFFGMLIVVSALWALVIHEIREAAK